MTILEASNILFEYFKNNDSFCFEDDYKKLYITTDNKQEVVEALHLALENFTIAKILRKSKNKDIWILEKSFSSLEQNVSISPENALSISKIINQLEIDHKTDILNVTDKDIGYILAIIGSLIKEKDQQ